MTTQVAMPDPVYGRYRVKRFGETQSWLVMEIHKGFEGSVAWCASEDEAIAEAKKRAAADRKERSDV